ncbi:hypothetical protein GF357_05240 [Candidatus Dojkabacteria bacterium]|nr:hypothetical protein [Candidatus Dojkabacteria bacterium]
MRITEFWMQNIYLIANILILLSFASFTWLYSDLFLKGKKRCHFYIAVGGMLLTFSFLGQLIFSLANRTIVLSPTYNSIRTIIQSGGLAITLAGVFIEKVPLKPGIKTKDSEKELSNSKSRQKPKSGSKLKSGAKKSESKKARKKAFVVLLLAGPVINFFLSIAIAARTMYKFREGESKQFKLNFLFWVLLSGYFLIESLSGFGKYFPLLELATQTYSSWWVISQLTLIVCAVLMFGWLGQFIAFRAVAQVFLSVWRWVILVSLISATVLSIYMIKLTESQISTILERNVGLIDFNLDQIETNSRNVLSVITQDNELQSGIESQDYEMVQNKLDAFVQGNLTLDRMFITDASGLLIYDTHNPTAQGESMTGNLILKKAILDKSQQSGYFAKQMLASADRLTYQVSEPVFGAEGELKFLVSAQKFIDDQYADLLRNETGQEIVIYVNGRRSASSLVGYDGIARYERMPEEFQASELLENDVFYGQIEILNENYYVAVNPLKNFESEQFAKILIGTKQQVLIESTNNALFRAFGLAFMISIAMTIPSFYLARSLEKNISA